MAVLLFCLLITTGCHMVCMSVSHDLSSCNYTNKYSKSHFHRIFKLGIYFYVLKNVVVMKKQISSTVLLGVYQYPRLRSKIKMKRTKAPVKLNRVICKERSSHWKLEDVKKECNFNEWVETTIKKKDGAIKGICNKIRNKKWGWVLDLLGLFVGGCFAIWEAVIHHCALVAFTESLQVENNTLVRVWKDDVCHWELNPFSVPCLYDIPEKSKWLTHLHLLTNKSTLYLTWAEVKW